MDITKHPAFMPAHLRGAELLARARAKRMSFADAVIIDAAFGPMYDANRNGGTTRLLNDLHFSGIDQREQRGEQLSADRFE